MNITHYYRIWYNSLLSYLVNNEYNNSLLSYLVKHVLNPLVLSQSLLLSPWASEKQVSLVAETYLQLEPINMKVIYQGIWFLRVYMNRIYWIWQSLNCLPPVQILHESLTLNLWFLFEPVAGGSTCNLALIHLIWSRCRIF